MPPFSQYLSSVPSQKSNKTTKPAAIKLSLNAVKFGIHLTNAIEITANKVSEFQTISFLCLIDVTPLTKSHVSSHFKPQQHHQPRSDINDANLIELDYTGGRRRYADRTAIHLSSCANDIIV
jgi:DNA-binding transcriptional ArsR family regulator